MAAKDLLPNYVEFLALAYHEARNVRQLFRQNAVSRKTYEPLAQHLPPDDQEAWKRLIAVQQGATEAESASAAADVFMSELGCSAADVSSLFENPGWKRIPQHGGQRWAAIAKRAAELGAAIDRDDETAAKEIAAAIESMRHNSGTVHEKLARLKGAVQLKA
jgi:hypothetical protein